MHRKSLECTHYMLIRFAWKLGGFLLVSVPRELPFLLVGLEREGLPWSSAVLRFRLSLSSGRRCGKKKKRKKKREGRGRKNGEERGGAGREEVGGGRRRGERRRGEEEEEWGE